MQEPRSFLSLLCLSLLPITAVLAQPSPDLQKRISAAIAAAANGTGQPDYTAFVNPFIGTGAKVALLVVNEANICLDRQLRRCLVRSF